MVPRAGRAEESLPGDINAQSFTTSTPYTGGEISYHTSYEKDPNFSRGE